MRLQDGAEFIGPLFSLPFHFILLVSNRRRYGDADLGQLGGVVIFFLSLLRKRPWSAHSPDKAFFFE